MKRRGSGKSPGGVGLGELGDLRARLQRNQREAAEREALARVEREHRQQEQALFALSVGPITMLAATGQTQTPGTLPAPQPRQRQRDEAAALRESLSDGFDVDSLLETDAMLSFRRPEIGPDVVRKLRRGGWAIQAHLDLHGLRRDEARARLLVFLRDAERNGLRCVRVVHGKGNGSPGREPVLKHRVQGWLVQMEAVIAFTQARAAEGGNGALVLLLRPRPGTVKGAP